MRLESATIDAWEHRDTFDLDPLEHVVRIRAEQSDQAAGCITVNAAP